MLVLRVLHAHLAPARATRQKYADSHEEALPSYSTDRGGGFISREANNTPSSWLTQHSMLRADVRLPGSVGGRGHPSPMQLALIHTPDCWAALTKQTN